MLSMTRSKSRVLKSIDTTRTTSFDPEMLDMISKSITRFKNLLNKLLSQLNLRIFVTQLNGEVQERIHEYLAKPRNSSQVQ